MTPQLSTELRQALARQPDRPLQVEDPLTRAQYVLVRLDAYEQLQQGADYDTSDPDPRAFYPAFAAAVQDDLDASGREAYDADGIPQEPSRRFIAAMSFCSKLPLPAARVPKRAPCSLFKTTEITLG
jgi:hypothetical protein